MFSYVQIELLGKDIDILIPQFFQNTHKNSLIRTISQDETRIKLNKEKTVFGQEKNGYIIPISLVLRAIPSLNNEFCFIANLCHEKQITTCAKAILIVNLNLQIIELSSSKTSTVYNY